MANAERVMKQQITPGGFYLAIVDVTPQLAQEWLTKQHINRTLRDEKIDSYASDMLAGRWRQNGQTICFMVDGLLGNGQHRLHAVVRSGCTITMAIAYNVSYDALESIDRGITKTVADIYQMHGIQNQHLVAGAIATIWRGRTKQMQTAYIPSAGESLALYNSGNVKDRLAHSIQIARKSSKFIAMGLGAGLHFLCAEKDKSLADVFFTMLGSGERMGNGDPVYALRQRLLTFKSKEHRHVQIRPAMRVALTIKAWNAEREGRKMLTLRWNENEDYPEIL